MKRRLRDVIVCVVAAAILIWPLWLAPLLSWAQQEKMPDLWALTETGRVIQGFKCAAAPDVHGLMIVLFDPEWDGFFDYADFAPNPVARPRPYAAVHYVAGDIDFVLVDLNRDGLVDRKGPVGAPGIGQNLCEAFSYQP